MIEAPDELQSTLKIPDSHIETCKAQNILTAGNAAGRTDDLLNLKGQTMPPPKIPAGFEARGIVALVFSCLTAFIGMAVISWYDPFPFHQGIGIRQGFDHLLQVRCERNWEEKTSDNMMGNRGCGETKHRLADG